MNQAKSFETDTQWSPRSAGMSRPIAVTPEDEQEFQIALENYKDRSGRLFPTCSELLEVLRSLGYEKRIWTPVELWSPMSGLVNEGDDPASETLDVLGWYSTASTSLAP